MNDDRVAHQQLVTTIREKCRTCYTCVRECPAKAIQILDGQASVIQTRCIGCGNCVTVCSQNAKQVLSGIEDAERVLAGPAPVAAIVAPSYPAEFTECARRPWSRRFASSASPTSTRSASAPTWWPPSTRACSATTTGRYVATTCPAVVSYVRKYHPDLLDRLAPIVSPMLAIARVLHVKYGPDLKVVFIGPCIAKKGEAQLRAVRGRGRRRAHLRRAARHVRGPRHPRWSSRPRTATSIHRTAAWAPSSPSPAACCRRPTSRRTCSAATS